MYNHGKRLDRGPNGSCHQLSKRKKTTVVAHTRFFSTPKYHSKNGSRMDRPVLKCSSTEAHTARFALETVSPLQNARKPSETNYVVEDTNPTGPKP